MVIFFLSSVESCEVVMAYLPEKRRSALLVLRGEGMTMAILLLP
jgi:hypothetical protein